MVGAPAVDRGHRSGAPRLGFWCAAVLAACAADAAQPTHPGAPGRLVRGLRLSGGGACGQTPLGELLSAIRAAHPELDDITELRDLAGDRDGSYIHAYLRDDGGFSFTFRRGSGDCPSGCIDEEYFYFATDDACRPRAVGHFSRVYTSEACYETEGEPMFGHPAARDFAAECDADLGPQPIDGTHVVHGMGFGTPCDFGGDAEQFFVDGPITLEIDQDPDDLTRGTVRIGGTGYAFLDENTLAVRIERQRFVAEALRPAAAECPSSYDSEVEYDFEQGAGRVFVAEQGKPDCESNPSAFCAGDISLTLRAIE